MGFGIINWFILIKNKRIEKTENQTINTSTRFCENKATVESE
jgi:hypothetical protein